VFDGVFILMYFRQVAPRLLEVRSAGHFLVLSCSILSANALSKLVFLRETGFIAHLQIAQL